MEKLKSSLPNNLNQMIAESTAEDLPSTCSSLLDFFLSLQLFHQVVDELTDPQRSLLRKNTETALDFKQKGNNCFTSRHYDQALSFYTQALRFAPMDYADEAEKNLVSTLYVNRASTLHKMDFLVECVRDCDRAVVLSPSYSKAWYRRGKANASLESYEDAINDLNVSMSLEISPSGKSRIKDEVDIIYNLSQRESSSIVKCNEKSLNSYVESHPIELQCISTPAKGRGMSSVGDIPQASLIHSEEPYAAILLKHNRDTHCHFCLNELPKDSVPCSSCSIPLYCSQNCQVQAGGLKSLSNINSNSANEKLSSDIHKHISSLSLANSCGNSVIDSNEVIPEHRHECGGVHWPAVLPSEVILAGRVLVKLMEHGKHSLETIEALELIYNYAQMPFESKLELHIYSIVLTYCLHRSCTVQFPLVGGSASQLVIIISQIRVNSMAIVHMKSPESYGSLEQPRKVSLPIESLTSNVEQVKVGQAIYSTASLFNHSCEPNIHAYFCSRTLFIRSTEFVTAGNPLELSYGPQVGQWDLTERKQLLQDQYAFDCECSGCSELNFSDLVINSFSCPKPGCSGAVLDEHWAKYPLKCSLEHRLPVVDKLKREDIKKVGCRMFEKQDGASGIDPGSCLNCGSYLDLEVSRLKSKKAWSCIKRLQDTILSRKMPDKILSDALKAIHLLRSTLHAYNKEIAQVHSKKRSRLEHQRMGNLVFVKYNLQLESRQKRRAKLGDSYDPISLSDMESDDEWITEKEDPCLPVDNSWMDVSECFEVEETSRKRKRGPRDLRLKGMVGDKVEDGEDGESGDGENDSGDESLEDVSSDGDEDA